MPATTLPDDRVQWMRPSAMLEARVDFLLWQPLEAAQAREHEVAPDANVDLLIEVSDSGARAEPSRVAFVQAALVVRDLASRP